jgi:hypothetical protein
MVSRRLCDLRRIKFFLTKPGRNGSKATVMAQIDLSPTISVSPDMAAANVQPIVGTPTFFQQPNTSGIETVRETSDLITQVQENNTRKIQAEQKSRQLKNDAAFNTLPTLDQQEVLGYQKQYGGIPRNAGGGIDIDKVRTQSQEDARMRRANFMMASTMAGMERNEGVKVNPATGKLETVLQAIDPSTGQVAWELFPGTVPPETLKGTSGGRGDFTALQREQVVAALAGDKKILQDIPTMFQLVNTPSGLTGGGPVGPLSGSVVGQFGSRVSAAMGGEEVFNAQRKLTQFISRQAIEAANLLKGPLTEKELAFLRNSIPRLDDTEAVWSDWLNGLYQMYRDRIQNTETALSGKEAAGDFVDPATAEAAVRDYQKRLEIASGSMAAQTPPGAAPQAAPPISQVGISQAPAPGFTAPAAFPEPGDAPPAELP